MATDEENVITQCSQDEFKAVIQVAKSTLRILMNAKKGIKSVIEEKTNTNITLKMKSDGTKNKLIEIIGNSHQNVYEARRKIKEIGRGHASMPTHFTCVKITDSQIRLNYSKFKEDQLNGENSTLLAETIFIKPEKLHITFGVLCLTEEEKRCHAENHLADCLETIVKPIQSEYGKIEIKVRGVEIMKGNPKYTRVLYAKIESEPLQKIADAITKSFINAGLAKEEAGRDTVKLHMTIMNVKSTRGKTKSFDATHILDEYANFEFGIQEINHISLAAMMQTDSEGFYKCIASIHF